MGNVKQRQYIFLLIILAVTIVLTFLVLKSFLLILALGAVFAVTFQPVMRFFERITKGKSISAFLTTVIVIICIILPLVSVASQILIEAVGLYGRLQSGGYTEFATIFENLSQKLPFAVNVELDTQAYIQKGLSLLVSNLGSLFSNVANIIANLLIFFVVLYYLLKDGQSLRKTAVHHSPLVDTDDELVLGKMGRAVNSVMRGRVLLAVLQGFLAAIGMFIFGVPNPALWGSVTVITALVPGVGTALVVVPAALYLFWKASLGNAIGFLIWGVVLVGMIDNVLGPKLLGKSTQVHPLLILLSVLGGITVFGPLGFLIGPLVISLLFALLEILFTMSHNESLPKA